AACDGRENPAGRIAIGRRRGGRGLRRIAFRRWMRTLSPRSRTMASHMTAHPLSALLAPSSVAIFGASNDPTRISGRSLRYFREAGFQGGLYPINPTRDTVQGLKAYPDVASVSGEVECAVIAVPANLAIEAMESCVEKGVKAVVMFTAGFAE